MRQVKRSRSGFSNRENTQKSKRSYHRPTQFNQMFLGDFSRTQGLAIFLVLLTIIGGIGGYYFYQTSAFHSYVKNPNYHDPLEPLFSYCHRSPSTDITGWNTRSNGTSFNIFNGAACGSNNIELTPSDSASAVGIYTGSTIELSTASSKILFIGIGFHWVGSGNNPTWHMFLTTDSSAPTKVLNYDPRAYSTTAFVMQGVGGTNSFSTQVFIQTDQTKRIFDTVNNQGACDSGDSLILCSNSFPNNINTYSVTAYLNYTGSSGTASSQTSNQLQITQAGGSITNY